MFVTEHYEGKLRGERDVEFRPVRRKKLQKNNSLCSRALFIARSAGALGATVAATEA